MFYYLASDILIYSMWILPDSEGCFKNTDYEIKDVLFPQEKGGIKNMEVQASIIYNSPVDKSKAVHNQTENSTNWHSYNGRMAKC